MRLLLLSLTVILAGCAASRPDLPYPVFVQADELPDVFMASMPGVRAKQFAGNPRTRRSSNRIVFPANWQGATGASPGKSLELYVVYGDLSIGNLKLSPGGYAWFPAGYSGANLSSQFGAEVLYFLDDANPATQIQSPIIYSAEATNWQPLSDRAADAGLQVKELRRDPGSGARAWLLRVEPRASIPWQMRRRILEGYLLSGRYRGSECHAGEAVTGEYVEGGYFFRPAEVVHGGPQEKALETSTWFMRIKGDAEPVFVDGCRPPAP